MLIEIRNIPGSMFLHELRENVQQHVKYGNFFAVPKLNQYNQFEEAENQQKQLVQQQSKQQQQKQRHSKEEPEKFKRRTYEVAYFEPLDQNEAKQFVERFNGKLLSYQSKVRTTNYKKYKDAMWNVQLVQMNFEDVFQTRQSRDEKMNAILQKDIFEANHMHQEFLQLLLKDKIQKKQEQRTELVDYLKNFEQRPVYETKQGECTFWDQL
ncbi:Conserved_hypothetical protein [Hexamita inflata]|uniref:Uncharacterized protein n=1 Tax=Hexamita inflata TaxID=28002 RepID=A0AA86U0V8_9EUKA|nr:Conserved hypothetical protein [Hexamita inflata]